MRTFENFTFDEKEKLFLEIAHLDDLVIGFNFIDTYNRNSLRYSYYNKWYFCLDKGVKEFFIDMNLWNIFRNRYNMPYIDVQVFFENMIEKYFNIHGYEYQKM
ncbi:hypothetical protein M0Q50_10360 [bacterium]|jgi:hypothetical protein|nr:hypothetical protein [bacterium]